VNIVPLASGKTKLLVDGRLIESMDVLHIEKDQILTLVDHSMDLVVRRHASAMRIAVRRVLMAKDHFFLFGPSGHSTRNRARSIFPATGASRGCSSMKASMPRASSR
jgi:hypothetical protein